MPPYLLLLTCLVVLALFAAAAAGTPTPRRPRIRKLGTIDCDLVETTPFVFGGKIYRLEWVRTSYRRNRLGKDYLRIVERDTGREVSAFGEGHTFSCALVDGDTVYVSGSKPQPHLARHAFVVTLFASQDLKTWTQWTALDDPKYGLLNTSLCKAGRQYVMMFEISYPKAEAGKAFTARFAVSRDMKKWTVTPPECTYAKNRYTAPHCLRFCDGWYYNFFLEAVGRGRYEQCVVRSRDLVHWRKSPLNPVLKASAADRTIANPRLTARERRRIATARNLNNSDIDLCEYQGKVVINYSWGNQLGIEHLAEAEFDGTLREFLQAWFPKPARRPGQRG